MKSPFKSRKFLFAALSAIGIFVAEAFGMKIPPEVLDYIKTIILGYLGAEGAIDALRMFKKEEPKG